MTIQILSDQPVFNTNLTPPQVNWRVTGTGFGTNCSLTAQLMYSGGTRNSPRVTINQGAPSNTNPPQYNFSVVIPFPTAEVNAVADIVIDGDLTRDEPPSEAEFVTAYITITITNDH